jgi:hypothetical protein
LALLVSGVIGGWVSESGRHDVAFLLCGLVWIPSFALALRYAREAPRPPSAEGLRETASGFLEAARTPGLMTVVAILFLWSFNPSWVTVQYLHVTGTLAMDEQTFGNASSVFSAGCVVASIAYAFYCRRVPMGRLVGIAILTGVVGYGAYLDTSTPALLYAASFVSGVANMTGILIQLDVAARLIPVRVAATGFAVLMAVTNVAASVSEAVGTQVYGALAPSLGAVPAYEAIVVASALFAASCWMLVPRLRREIPAWWP